MTTSEASESVAQKLGRLERADLIRLAAAQPDIEYIFRHALVQECTYNTLVRADRRRVHRAAGETLEALLAGREPPAELVPQLARHFEEAADHARALHYFTLAGDVALARYANTEAVAAYASALTAAERSSAGAERSPVEAGLWQHMFEARGRALELNSQFTEALANYQAMAERANALGDRGLALAAAVAAGQLYATPTPLFDPRRAERMAEEALAEARALGDEAAEAKILWNQLNLYRFTQRNPQARVCGERSLEIARRLEHKTQAALTLNDLIHVYADLGLWPEAEQASEEARRLWRELGNIAMLADSLSTTALYKSMLGEFALALSQALEAHQHSVAIGNLWGQSYSLSAMSWPYWFTGHPDRAIEATSECLRIGQLAGYLVAEVMDGAFLAFMYGELGDTQGGLELAQRAALSTRHTGGVGMLSILATRVHLQLRSASIEQAVATLEIMEQETQQPILWEVDAVLRARSEVALAQGDATRGLVAAQVHVARLRELGLLAYLPTALTGLAQALLLDGRVPEARETLMEALACAQALGASMLEWTVLYALGKLEAEHGSAAEAGQHWAKAREIVTVIAARIPTPKLRQSFLARPELRALFGDSSPLISSRQSEASARPAL